MKNILITILTCCLLCGCSVRPNEINQTELLMDTVCTIRVSGKDKEAAVNAAFDKVADIAKSTDYYSTESEVSRINSASAYEPISVSQDVVNILTVALDVCNKSNGAFDITVAPLKDLWSFQSGDHIPPTDSEITQTLNLIDYTKLALDKEQNTVTKHDSLTKIDLGGAAKGYAADCARDVLSEYDIDYAVIDLGGNICVYGKNPSTRDGSWNIGIQKPFSSSGEIAETVNVSEGCVVTSGTYQRFFKHNENLYHHILNPKDGYPSNNGKSSASIISSSALLADCMSTACMVLPPDEAFALAESYGIRLIYK